MSPARRRIVYAAIVALVAFVAPLLLWWVGFREARPLIAALIVGPMVFQLLSRPRPEWWHGLAFAVVPAIGFGIWWGIWLPFEHSGAGYRAVAGIVAFFLAFFAGMIGASVASLFARMFDSKLWNQTSRRFQPWHLGAALALVDIAVVVAVAVISV